MPDALGYEILQHVPPGALAELARYHRILPDDAKRCIRETTLEATGWTQEKVDEFLIGKCGKRHKRINCTSPRLAGTIRLKASHLIRLNRMYPTLTLRFTVPRSHLF